MTLKSGQTVTEALDNFAEKFDTQGCRKLKIPAAGSPVTRQNAPGEQLKLDE